MKSKKRILIAPLNWGLGHATRCIPIINALLENEFDPVIGSDGIALALLKKEFPSIETVNLIEYDITYPKDGKDFKKKLLLNTPRLLKVINKEKKLVKRLVQELNLDGIISDNRFGVRSKRVPSVFVSHQLNVLSGTTSWLSSSLHQKIIAKYDECWVPDVFDEPNLSGALGHMEHAPFTIKYLGAISRFKKELLPKKHDLMVLLSGPEPQRSMLSKKLKEELQNFEGNILFVEGVIEANQKVIKEAHMTLYNYMTSSELSSAINSSRLVIARSGYTTILDLAALEKKAFFIPTPGQFEQEYLAESLQQNQLAPYCKQEGFNLKALDRVSNFNGLQQIKSTVNWTDLLSLFERKREFATNT